jgi:cytochrome c553
MKFIVQSARILTAACALLLQPIAHATEESDQLIRTALLLDSHPQQGAALFKVHCAGCHGKKGEGNAGSYIPAIAGQRQAYLVKQFADFSLQERDSQAMHRTVTTKAMNDQQSWIDVASFINQLPPTRTMQKGTGANLLLGEAIFREQCSSCHEEDARGDDDGFIPSLRNQHYSYLLRQMRSLANGHRRNIDPDLDLFLASIKDDEMQATADYLSRLRGPTRDRQKMRPNGVVSD